MRDAVIVSAVRTAVGKAGKGSLKDWHPVDMGAAVVREALRRCPEAKEDEIEDVIIGSAVPEAEQGMNMARLIALRAGLPTSVPGVTVNRYCASGLQTIAMAAERIRCGAAEMIVAGGVESMSLVPMEGNKVALNPYLAQHMPQAYMSMGHTAEEVARRFGITREEQDRFALRSHRKAAKAVAEGRFEREILPLPKNGKLPFELDEKERQDLQDGDGLFAADECVRPNTDIDQLSQLPPVFHEKGTVTAGNASPRNDGAAAVLVTSPEKAEQLGVKPLAVYRSYAVAGVDPEIMGVGPVAAVPKALQQAGIEQGDVALMELNEAFASQALRVIEALEWEESRVNVNGGAIALGHPLGCTGTKLSVSLFHELKRRKEAYGVVTMCIGGGMGAAGVFENPERS